MRSAGAGASASPDAAGSGGPLPDIAAARRAASPDEGTLPLDGVPDWIARGAEPASIREVLRVAHDLMWPAQVHYTGRGSALVVIPVIIELADELAHVLHAIGAVAPITPRGAGANTSRRGDAPTRPPLRAAAGS